MLSEDKYLLLLGRKIEKLGYKKYKLQSELAEACEIDTRTLRRIIKATQNPSILILRKIAFALDIPLSELVDVK